jgi:hypothetical protein
MARLVTIARWAHNFVIFWSCDNLLHYLMITRPWRCFGHRITNYFSFIKYVDRIRMRIQKVKGATDAGGHIVCTLRWWCEAVFTKVCFNLRFSQQSLYHVFGMWCRIVRYKSTNVSEKPPASISQTRLLIISRLRYSYTLKLHAICSSETSVNFYRTARRYIPESRSLHCYYMVFFPLR